jgi:hypothetical protein
MPRAGIGLPHPGIDGQMLYLGDRPEAGTIARLTASAPLEREHGSTVHDGICRVILGWVVVPSSRATAEKLPVSTARTNEVIKASRSTAISGR